MKFASKDLRNLPALAGALGLAGVLTLSGPAGAAPMPFGGNYYDYVAALDISWADAEAAAEAATYHGVQGHLATITSGSENTFVLGLAPVFGSFAGAWLGGEVTGSGTGTWVVGPEAGQDFSVGGTAILGAYANWGGIEPNNAPSKVYMNIGTSFAGIGTGNWADASGGVSSGGDPIKGYFIEYETSAVPLPAALPLFATGLGLIGIFGRRRRRRGPQAAA
jgi:hypothetical protein